jgi:uncharacterized protein (TIGR02996 family)
MRPRTIVAALNADLDAEPYGHGPRLVLADWYEEHGQDERAEFLRWQVREDRVPYLSPAGSRWCWRLPYTRRLLRETAQRPFGETIRNMDHQRRRANLCPALLVRLPCPRPSTTQFWYATRVYHQRPAAEMALFLAWRQARADGVRVWIPRR